jgi:hypothetical protein
MSRKSWHQAALAAMHQAQPWAQKLLLFGARGFGVPFMHQNRALNCLFHGIVFDGCTQTGL